MPRERVGSAIALISAMLGVGGALGLPLAGFVAEHADFHALFWITAAAGLVAFVGILHDRPGVPGRSGGRVDLVGAVLLAAGLVCLMLPLAQSRGLGLGRPAGRRSCWSPPWCWPGRVRLDASCGSGTRSWTSGRSAASRS